MNNLVLIGMPGSGKSTLGQKIAARYDLDFIDTDELIEQRYQCSLQQLLNRHGIASLRAIEEQVLSSLNVNNHLISTGGSAVYSTKAMSHLQSIGRVVYLHISMATLNRRVDNSAARGLVKYPQHSIYRLYGERLPLYHKWADVTVDNNRPLSAWQTEKLSKQIMSAKNCDASRKLNA